MDKKIVNEINYILNDYLEITYKNVKENSIDRVYSSIQKLLNTKNKKYDIKDVKNLTGTYNTSLDELQRKLSKINEFTGNRKKLGVYYTPQDVTKYIIINTFINYLYYDNERMYNFETGSEYLLKNSPNELEEIIFEKIIFDPTCGAGEFLINTYKIKINLLLKLKNKITEDDYISILRTIKGNDLDKDSTDICKIRLFIDISNHVSTDKLGVVAEILNTNFYNYDFVMINKKKITRSDIIVGNPPYVEYSKMDIKPSNKFGNIYADVVKNSIISLKRNGVYGLVVPLSYIATSRMQKIRNYVEENTRKQFILNFADRPDCLFTGVHQKLCIIVGVKSRANHFIYTSNYRHWYKSERKNLLNGCSVIENKFRHDGFIPKIGNEIESNIFRKIFTNTDDNVYKLSVSDNKGLDIYLNMRATFYIKAFSYNPGSKEYKKFIFNNEHRDFILCLLNSSLYFLFWTMVSDCWHITLKELKHMYVPTLDVEGTNFTNLAKRLENKLEKTKKYIGTVQTDYEYKHKECFDILNEIDDELSKVYKLTKEELEYIKSFALKYRTGLEK